jgi:hypothetical protein
VKNLITSVEGGRRIDGEVHRALRLFLVCFCKFKELPMLFCILLYTEIVHYKTNINIYIMTRWLTPEILATQKADIRRTEVQSSPWQIVCETLSRKYPSQKQRLVEWLKVKALSSSPSTAKKKKKDCISVKTN